MDRHARQERQQRQPSEARGFFGQQGQGSHHGSQADQSREQRMIRDPQADEHSGHQGGPRIPVPRCAEGQPQCGQRQRCLQGVDLCPVADDHHPGRKGKHHGGGSSHQHARDWIEPLFRIEPVGHLQAQGVDEKGRQRPGGPLREGSSKGDVAQGQQIKELSPQKGCYLARRMGHTQAKGRRR